MIVFRQTDADAPFLWEGDRQPAQRWHDVGEGPAQYVASTPEAAWAEFLRHSGIDDPADIEGVVRVMWAIEMPDQGAMAIPRLPVEVMTGGDETYPACRAEAARLRGDGARSLAAPTAALLPGSTSGWRVDDGLVHAPPRQEFTFVFFGTNPDAVGWVAGLGSLPEPALIRRVRYLR